MPSAWTGPGGCCSTLRDEVDGSTDTCAWSTLEQAHRLPRADLAKLGSALAGDGIVEAR